MNVVLAVAIYIGICYTWGDTYFSNADAKWGYNFNEPGTNSDSTTETGW